MLFLTACPDEMPPLPNSYFKIYLREVLYVLVPFISLGNHQHAVTRPIAGQRASDKTCIERILHALRDLILGRNTRGRLSCREPLLHLCDSGVPRHNSLLTPSDVDRALSLSVTPPIQNSTPLLFKTSTNEQLRHKVIKPD